MFGRPTKKERAERAEIKKELAKMEQEAGEIRRRIINARGQYRLANGDEPKQLTIDWETWRKMRWYETLYLGMKINQVFSDTELIEVS